MTLARGGQLYLTFSLSRRHPASQPVEVEPRGLLVGGDDEQLAQTPRALARRQAPLGPALCAQFARGLECGAERNVLVKVRGQTGAHRLRMLRGGIGCE